MNDNSYFIEVRHRPRRVAFLVDAEQSPDKLLDEVMDFNVSTWGGRYNPLIPVLGGEVTEHYWQLLRVANPDVLYAYCDLSSGAVRRIISDIRPTDVVRHGEHPLQPEGNDFRVRINRQATVLPALLRIMEHFPAWARKPEPAALVFELQDARSLSSFVRRNFGGNEHYYFYCRDHQIASVTLPPNDVEVIKAVAGNPNLVLPIDVCAFAPRTSIASVADTAAALTLCYGTSPWNFVEYWNTAHFGDSPSAITALSRMWMNPTLLEDSAFYEAFLELVRRRVFPSGHHHYLRLVSYDQTKENMSDVTRRICADLRWGTLYPAEPVIRTKGVANF